MALGATGIWEIRPTDGTANAGGGFNLAGSSPGTDYSQQNGVQVAFDGATISAATAGASATIVITGYAAAATDNRNYVAITGGTNFLTGIYEIVSVAAGVSGVGTWTLDRTCTSGVGASMTGNMGGARGGSSLGYTCGTTTLQASLVAGHTVYVKGSGQAWNEAVSLTVAGTAASPIKHVGYNSSRTDAPTGSSRPLNDRATAAGDAITCSQTGNEFYNLMATRAGDAGFSHSGVSFTLKNCRFYNNAGEGIEANSTTLQVAIDTELDTNAVTGWGGGNATPLALGCYIHDNASNGINIATNPAQIEFSIISANTASGMTGSSTTRIMNSAFVGNAGTSSDGLTVTTPGVHSYAMNNIFAYNGRYGISATDADSVYSDYNCYYQNGTAAITPASGVTGAPNQPGTHDQVNVDPQFTNSGVKTFATGDVNTTAETITITGHGYVAGQVCFISSTTTVPGGLTAYQAYYILVTDANTIQLSSTRGGSAVNLTSQGTGTHTITATGLANFAIGTNLKAKGWPGAFPSGGGGVTVGYLDIGPTQRQETSSTGGGGAMVNRIP